jgi:hypothetical protein
MSGKILIVAIMILISLFYPSFLKFSSCRYCIWTIAGAQGGGLYNKEWLVEEPIGFYFYGNLFEFRAGYNDYKINKVQISEPLKDYHWIRVRLGFPVQAITIDKMEKVNDWHIHLEGVFWFNFVLWLIISPVALGLFLRLKSGLLKKISKERP